MAQQRLLRICPESAGGLPTPRLAAELQASASEILSSVTGIRNSVGEEVAAPFVQGAQAALELAREHNVKIALLKANSPSCGNQKIYDGSFHKCLVEGEGVTSALLRQHDIKVFNENQIDQLEQYLNTLEA